MSFNCYDSAGHKITTTSYLNCNPSLDITMTASEFANLANAQSATLTVADLFAYPTSEQLLQVFQIGFYLPLQAYLLAWVYGVLFSYFKTED